MDGCNRHRFNPYTTAEWQQGRLEPTTQDRFEEAEHFFNLAALTTQEFEEAEHWRQLAANEEEAIEAQEAIIAQEEEAIEAQEEAIEEEEAIEAEPLPDLRQAEWAPPNQPAELVAHLNLNQTHQIGPAIGIIAHLTQEEMANVEAAFLAHPLVELEPAGMTTARRMISLSNSRLFDSLVIQEEARRGRRPVGQ